MYDQSLIWSEAEETELVPLVEAMVDKWFEVGINPISWATFENRLIFIVEHAYFKGAKRYEDQLQKIEAQLRPKPEPQPGICWLYRLFSAENRLLYVGVTVNVPSRLAHHRKTYGDLLDHWTLEIYGTREEALRQERLAISHEAPAFNYTHPVLD